MTRCSSDDAWVPSAHLLRHLNVMHEEERFCFEQGRNRVRRYDTTRCWWSRQLHGWRRSRTERVRPEVRNDRVYSHYTIKWDWNEMMFIYSGVCRINTPQHSVNLRYPCISLPPPSLLEDVLGGRDQAFLEMHLQIGIEWTKRCTWRPGSSEFGDSLGGRNGVR